MKISDFIKILLEKQMRYGDIKVYKRDSLKGDSEVYGAYTYGRSPFTPFDYLLID